MDCEIVRESISTRLDGEHHAVSEELVGAHLRRCLACQLWQTNVMAFNNELESEGAEDAPNLVPQILSSVASPQYVYAVEWLKACRIVLAVCALMQLISSLPTALATTGVPIHTAHELDCWDIALAVGFLVAALRPARAAGMVPMVAVVGVGLLVTAVMDVSSGNATLSGETSHTGELVGMAFLYLVGRYEHMHESVLQTAA